MSTIPLFVICSATGNLPNFNITIKEQKRNYPHKQVQYERIVNINSYQKTSKARASYVNSHPIKTSNN